MINKKIRNISIWLFTILLMCVTGLNIYKTLNNSIYYSDANYIADFSDTKKVSGFADNIFVWEVVENLWPNSWESWLPVKNTNFKIHVFYNIKWNLHWNIDVIQEGGYDAFWNLIIPEWTQYLSVWDIYLVSTKWDDYTILSHPNGSHLITSLNDISKKDLKNIIKSNSKVIEFRKWYKEELYYEENDIWEKYKISSEKNAYKNLSKKQKEDFENLESWFTK